MPGIFGCMENNAGRVQTRGEIQGALLLLPRGTSSCSLALYGISLVLRLGAMPRSPLPPSLLGSSSSCSCLLGHIIPRPCLDQSQPGTRSVAISSEPCSQPLESPALITEQRSTVKYGVQISTAEYMFASECLGLGGSCDEDLCGLPDFTYEVTCPARHHYRSECHMVQD